MFAFLRALINYLYPPTRWRRPPGHLISTYDIVDSDETLDIIMLANRARSPREAERLLKRYRVQNAADLIDKMPRRSSSVTVRQRLIKLYLAVFGHETGDPYRIDQANRENRRF